MDDKTPNSLYNGELKKKKKETRTKTEQMLSREEKHIIK